MDPTQGQATATELGAPRPLPQPQTGALGDDAADALAQTSLGPQIAQNVITAGLQNHGSPEDWAQNTVASVTAALAGFGAGGKVPPGAGALYGVGAAARQMQGRSDELNKEKIAEKNQQVAQQQRQQEIDNEKQRTQNQEGQFDKDYQLKLGENARQQAESIKQLALDDANLQHINDSNTDENFRRMREHTEFIQNQLDLEDAIKRAGGKDFELGGKPAPTFDDLGQMEQWANANNIAQDMHTLGYRPRPYLGSDAKYHIAEIPDDGVKEVKLKDADGKEFTTHLDALGVINYQQKVAEIRRANAETERAKMDTSELRDKAKQEKEDWKKNSSDDNRLRQLYATDSTVYDRALGELKKGVDSGAFGDGPDGFDPKNADYQNAKQFADEARDELHDTLTELRKKGHGYQSYGEQPAAAPAAAAAPAETKNLPDEITTARGRLPMPKPPTPGAAITREAFQPFLKQFNGDVEKAKQAAISEGWGPPAVQ
jgi:hypothetical protein